MKHIPYGRQSIDKDDIELAAEVLRSDFVTQGPTVENFEKALCNYTGAKYAVAVSSGTAALHIACLAAGVEKGDEVITSPITFVATSNAVLFCGGVPVFADIQEDTVNIDPTEIKKKLTEKTKALVPVHFAGHPVDLKEINEIARDKDLLVIEDASHALGAEYRSARIGSCRFSDMTTFSFHPVKHITTGEGGAVTTNSKDLFDRLLMFRNHGITKDENKMGKCGGPWYYEQQLLGFNYRITDFQCAIGLNQMKKLDNFLKQRKILVNAYREKLSDIEGLILPSEKDQVKSAWHIFYLRIKDTSKREKVFLDLKKAGIGVQVHYIPVHLQPYYRDNLGYKEKDYPRAENYYKQTITIPLYPGLLLNDIEYILSTLRESLK